MVFEMSPRRLMTALSLAPKCAIGSFFLFSKRRGLARRELLGRIAQVVPVPEGLPIVWVDCAHSTYYNSIFNTKSQVLATGLDYILSHIIHSVPGLDSVNVDGIYIF